MTVTDMIEKCGIVQRTRQIVTAKRLEYVLLFIILTVFLIMPYAKETVISKEERDDLNEQVQDLQKNISATAIFGNNLAIAVVGIIPVVGMLTITSAMYNTGYFMKAMGQPIWWVFLNPFYWIEISMYTLAVFLSIELLVAFIQRNIFHRGEKDKYSYPKVWDNLGKITAVLFAGAVLEYALIIAAVS